MKASRFKGCLSRSYPFKSGVETWMVGKNGFGQLVELLVPDQLGETFVDAAVGVGRVDRVQIPKPDCSKPSFEGLCQGNIAWDHPARRHIPFVGFDGIEEAFRAETPGLFKRCWGYPMGYQRAWNMGDAGGE